MASVAETGDEARRRINEVKWRNAGGQMEDIPGFNLEYNDLPIPEPPEEPTYMPPPPGHKNRPPRFTHTGQRANLRQAGKLATRNIIDQAHARSDGKALRANDGKVLKVPYVVRLKSR